MKWLIAGILLYLTRHSEAGALKCTPNSRDLSCASEKRAISPVQSLIELEREPESADIQCLAGSEWESNCHKCRCSASGTAVCLKQENCDIKSSEEPIKCKPFTSFRRDCNTCTCLKNGHGLCTLRGCLQERRSLNIQKRETIAPNSEEKSNQKHTIVKRGVCKANQEFQIDCNPCKCAANGLSYTCTHNECLEGNMNKEVEVFMESEGTDHIEKNSYVCKPRDTFYIGCNTCHCNPYGNDYSCTNKPCPLPRDVELFHELKEPTQISNNTKPTKRVVCIANRMFIMDCNTCWCNEDGTSFFCTRRVCIQDSTDENTTDDPDLEMKLRVILQECRPNEVFEMDCNMCRCNADGKSYSCTRRACIEVDDKNSTLTRQTRAAQRTSKTCQPGQEFRMDCNKCLCDDKGYDFSCTRNDCAAVNGNGGGDTFASARTKRDLSEQVETECVAGSVFDRECNVCRCTSDGKHATCTLKRCKQAQEVKESDTEATPSFRCTPGDQFQRDCNDCTCSADGKTVFCTVRLCDQDQVLPEV